MKKLTIVNATSGTYSDIDIAPGTTPHDILKQLGLDEKYVLTRGKGAEPMPNSENVYETVTDGTKLFATTDVEWGISQ